jgi:hypothetical protein
MWSCCTASGMIFTTSVVSRLSDNEASFLPHPNVLEPILALRSYHDFHLSIRDGNRRPDALCRQPSFDAHATKHQGFTLLHTNLSCTTPHRCITRIRPNSISLLKRSDDSRAWQKAPVNRPLFGQGRTRRNSERNFACNLPFHATFASAANCSKAGVLLPELSGEITCTTLGRPVMT